MPFGRHMCKNMKVLGIIAEYDPFHLGHMYHLEKAKHECEADYVVVVLGSDFAQRGLPAMFNRHTRARMAVDGGADMVFALPVFAGCSAARDFASGAIALLDALHCVDSLSFGSECGDLKLLQNIADQSDNLDDDALVKTSLRKGNSFALAISELAPNVKLCSNDILGVEYLRALKRLNSKIVPHTLKRFDNTPSAAYIRETLMLSAGDMDCLESNARLGKYLPNRSMETVINALNERKYMMPDDLSAQTGYALWLRLQRFGSFENIYGINFDLSQRFANKADSFGGFIQFIHDVKSRNYTFAKVARGLSHIFIDYTRDKHSAFSKTGFAPFARILALDPNASPLLSKIKSQSKVHIVSKAADYKKLPQAIQRELFVNDSNVGQLYLSVMRQSRDGAFSNNTLPEHDMSFPIYVRN